MEEGPQVVETDDAVRIAFRAILHNRVTKRAAAIHRHRSSSSLTHRSVSATSCGCAGGVAMDGASKAGAATIGIMPTIMSPTRPTAVFRRSQCPDIMCPFHTRKRRTGYWIAISGSGAGCSKQVAIRGQSKRQHPKHRVNRASTDVVVCRLSGHRGRARRAKGVLFQYASIGPLRKGRERA